MSEHNKAIIQRLVDEVWTQGNLDVLDEIIHPQAHPPHGPWDLPIGPEGFKQLVGMIRTSVPNLTRKAEDMTAEGDGVTLYYTLSGTHTGEGGLIPYPPSGEIWNMPGITAFRIADGKIIEEPWAVNSVGAFIQQVAKVTVRTVFDEIWNNRNPEAIPKYYSSDFIYHGPGGTERKGYEGIQENLSEFVSDLPNGARFLLQEQVAEANQVMTRWTLESEGVTKGSGISLIRMSDGKLSEEWEFSG